MAVSGIGKLFTSVGSGIVKVMSVIAGPPLAIVGTIVIKTSKFIVDCASVGTAYWIKNNFTGQSTLFGASTALTTLSSWLDKAGKKLNEACMSGYKSLAEAAHSWLEERLNAFGWASTGTYNDDPEKNDFEDVQVLTGKEAFKKHATRLANQKRQNIKSTEFDQAKISTNEWLKDGQEIFDSKKSKTDEELRSELLEWLNEAETNKSIKATLHIIDPRNPFDGVISSLLHKEESIVNLVSQDREFFSKKIPENITTKEGQALLTEGVNKIKHLLDRVGKALLDTLEPKTSITPTSANRVEISQKAGKSKA